MKVLNVNDYNEDHNNMAFKALQACGFEIINPQFDYNDREMSQVFDLVNAEFNKNFCDVIVGTGMGAFFAMCMCARKQVPCVLVNPILVPGMVLLKMGYKRPGGVSCLSKLECKYLHEVNPIGVSMVVDTQYNYLTPDLLTYMNEILHVAKAHYCELDGCTKEQLIEIFTQNKTEWFEKPCTYDLAL